MKISPNAEDHRKFSYALVARDVRRLTASIHQADIDDQSLVAMGAALDQLEARAVWAMLLYEPANGVLIQDPNAYSDGRPVTTTIDWGDGFATSVHVPDPADGNRDAEAEDLSEERWPDWPIGHPSR